MFPYVAQHFYFKILYHYQPFAFKCRFARENGIKHVAYLIFENKSMDFFCFFVNATFCVPRFCD